MFWTLLLALPLSYWLIEFVAGPRPNWAARREACVRVAVGVWPPLLAVLLPFALVGLMLGGSFTRAAVLIFGMPAMLVAIVTMFVFYPVYALMEINSHQPDDGPGLSRT